jgi:hypothetical protein
MAPAKIFGVVRPKKDALDYLGRELAKFYLVLLYFTIMASVPRKRRSQAAASRA